jgi:hypothetical protein
MYVRNQEAIRAAHNGYVSIFITIGHTHTHSHQSPGGVELGHILSNRCLMAVAGVDVHAVVDVNAVGKSLSTRRKSQSVRNTMYLLLTPSLQLGMAHGGQGFGYGNAGCM